MIICCVVTNPRLRKPTPVIVDTAASGATRRADDPGPSTNVGYIHRRESAMTQPPQQPPTQVFAQQRRSGCGTLLVALLVLAIITAIVIFLGAFGLLGWIFS
jgi:nitrate reductase NapE component